MFRLIFESFKHRSDSPASATRRRRPALTAGLVAACLGLTLLQPSPAFAAGSRPDFRAPWPCDQVRDYFHHSNEVVNAIDYNILGSADLGTPVLASARGVVTAVRYNGGYGNEVLIDHGGGWVTRVAHLNSFSIGVGQTVYRGQEVGRVGSTGASSGPHLHYEQIADGARVPIVIDGVAMNYDGHTRQHTGKNCYPPVGGAIGVKYQQAGGLGGRLGIPVGAETAAKYPGRWQQFEFGMILWHPDRGAHTIYGAILDRFRANGSEWTAGFAILDELTAGSSPVTGATGKYQSFEEHLILWSPATGAHAVHGEIKNAFVRLGNERVWGYPTTEESAGGESMGHGGRYQVFEQRLALWSPNTGAHSVYGAIKNEFVRVGNERAVGYPLAEEEAWGNGRRQAFERAQIYWTPTSGAWVQWN